MQQLGHGCLDLKLTTWRVALLLSMHKQTLKLFGSGGSRSLNAIPWVGGLVCRQPPSIEEEEEKEEEDRKVTTVLSQLLLQIIDEKRFFSDNKLFAAAAAADPAFFMASIHWIHGRAHS